MAQGTRELQLQSGEREKEATRLYSGEIREGYSVTKQRTCKSQKGGEQRQCRCRCRFWR